MKFILIIRNSFDSIFFFPRFLKYYFVLKRISIFVLIQQKVSYFFSSSLEKTKTSSSCALFGVILKVNLRTKEVNKYPDVLSSSYLHHKKQKIGYNTACRFCGDRLSQNHKQYREICHESETKPGDGLYVLEPGE